jgi:hypothetical protein
MHNATRTDRILVLKLASLAECDPRTAEKALRQGAEHIKGIVGDRLARELRALGMSPREAPAR